MKYRVQEASNGGAKNAWTLVEAGSMREAAARVAASLGSGTKEVLVVPIGAPKHSNGMPMVVHSFTCEVGEKCQ